MMVLYLLIIVTISSGVIGFQGYSATFSQDDLQTERPETPRALVGASHCLYCVARFAFVSFVFVLYGPVISNFFCLTSPTWLPPPSTLTAVVVECLGLTNAYASVGHAVLLCFPLVWLSAISLASLGHIGGMLYSILLLAYSLTGVVTDYLGLTNACASVGHAVFLCFHALLGIIWFSFMGLRHNLLTTTTIVILGFIPLVTAVKEAHGTAPSQALATGACIATASVVALVMASPKAARQNTTTTIKKTTTGATKTTTKKRKPKTPKYDFSPVYATETAAVGNDDRQAANNLVQNARVVQEQFNAAGNDGDKDKICIQRHTTKRTFANDAFCPSDVGRFQRLVNQGLVFKLAVCLKVASWKGAITFDDICNDKIFPVSMPYHPNIKSSKKDDPTRFEIYLQAFRIKLTEKHKFMAAAKEQYERSTAEKKRTGGWDSVKDIFEAILVADYSIYVGRSVKGGYWRYWGSAKAAGEKSNPMGYQTQTVIGIMQALHAQDILQYKGVVLWRASEGGKGGRPDGFTQVWLETFFGAMVFTTDRETRAPNGTDWLLNWAP
jgi:hypothetical protein